jgi:hypothetical protein
MLAGLAMIVAIFTPVIEYKIIIDLTVHYRPEVVTTTSWTSEYTEFSHVLSHFRFPYTTGR